VSGTVIEILADGTQRVGEGEVLARLDKAEYELALNSSLDALKSACLNLKSLKDTREKLVAAIEAREKELALARSDYQRRLKLKKGSSVTAEERERYRIQAEVAEANLEVSKKELLATESLLGKGPLAEHPSVTKAASDAEAAWLKLKRTDILSPVAGKVARRSAQLGAQVSPSAPIMLVAAEEGVWVDANFKESQLKRIKPGMLARVTVDMVGRKEEFRGVVEGLSAGTGSVFSLLPPENATGNWIKVVQRVPVRVTLDKESLGDSPLILGLSCRVEVLTEEPESVSPRRIGSWRYGTDVLSEDPSEIREEIKKITDYYLGNTESVGDREGEGEGGGGGKEGGDRNTGGISP
jgi:membrane fusion protein (multidrug efflux system)